MKAFVESNLKFVLDFVCHYHNILILIANAFKSYKNCIIHNLRAKLRISLFIYSLGSGDIPTFKSKYFVHSFFFPIIMKAENMKVI